MAAAGTTSEFPVDAILMELARAYMQKGDTEEARKAFTQIIDQHPGSPYTPAARAELENLKG
jgi:Tfp pilus assembly protein PilF